MNGYRPIVELMNTNFGIYGMAELSSAGNTYATTGGQFDMPMTIIGAGGTAPNQALGAEHSQVCIFLFLIFFSRVLSLLVGCAGSWTCVSPCLFLVLVFFGMSPPNLVVWQPPIYASRVVGAASGSLKPFVRSVLVFSLYRPLSLSLHGLYSYLVAARRPLPLFEPPSRRARTRTPTQTHAHTHTNARTQPFHAYVMGIPGLKICTAASPEAAYGITKSMIRDNGPGILFCPVKMMKGVKGELDLGMCLPLNKAAVLHAASEESVASGKVGRGGGAFLQGVVG